jgi:hypothetical protein
VNDVSLNWLNVFYAIEWALFAGFAIYLWYRLVKDAFEREEEDKENQRNAGSALPDIAEASEVH